jgi:hypothetical protein
MENSWLSAKTQARVKPVGAPHQKMVVFFARRKIEKAPTAEQKFKNMPLAARVCALAFVTNLSLRCAV